MPLFRKLFFRPIQYRRNQIIMELAVDGEHTHQAKKKATVSGHCGELPGVKY
jgi:hypothetical protein